MILGGDEMNRAFAILGVLQVWAIATFAVEPVATIDPCLAFILRDHVIRLMMEAAIEIEYAPVRQTKQIGIGIVVAGVLGVGTGRFNAQRGTPRERIVGFGDAVIHLSLGGMLRVHRDVSAVGPHKEGGSIVIILLEMRMQNHRRGLFCGEVIDSYFDVAPSWVRSARLEGADRTHRAHNQFAVIHDDARIHKPRPCAVVIELNQTSGDVIRGKRIAGA